jgi:membrane protease subunit HflC
VRKILLVSFILAAAFVGLVALGNLDMGPLVITREGQQKVILLLGEVRTVTKPGITLRLPFVEEVTPYEARWIALNSEPLPIQTKDGEQLTIDNYVIWRIDDPVAFRRAFRGNMSAAQNRIDRAVRDDVREVIGRHTLTDVLKDQRDAIMNEITENTRVELVQDGVDVRDVRINRTELPEGTEGSVYARMTTERQRLARKNRAEGEEKARRIRAEADREALVILANARRDAEVARGEGDAGAARIYADAFGRDAEFYGFLRSLEAYRQTLGEGTTLVLSPKSEFFRYLEGIDAGRRRTSGAPARQAPQADGGGP